MSSSRIPVHLITGFLGSGKTTFLNHFIRNFPGERVVVIENEVGKVNINGGLLSKETFQVEELTAGCLCCSLNTELIEVLERIHTQKDKIDRLIIETTGIADPEPVLLPFFSHPAVEAAFELIHTICLVDAENIEDWIIETEEAKKQIAVADVILINKSDLVQQDYLNLLTLEIRSINPMARVWTGSQGRFEVDPILEVIPHREETAARYFPKVEAASAANKHGMSTFTLIFDRPFQLQSLSNELWKLLVINAHQIYRVKGIIYANSYPVPVILQSVKNQLVMTDGEPDADGIPGQSKIVFIGKNLKKEAIQRIFSRHLIQG
ncbi:MAG: GTP-binding protein [Algoriphagus sp.]|uniref:CobW family GTP-binding protein n=1 Tax=Algoriphagus sp. TaxID=1872435 RepID=UPI0027303073|nr:GTP-binding protein [Algoriphagus sp.]MDP2042881.1 GTP-binding protein [Algoriphagus sp.]MDP3470684.1 GTP-binding protein [Algoriphagus sp.]